MNKVYVVMGTCGEYSDRNEWPVCAYKDEALATKHGNAAAIEAKRLRDEYEDSEWKKKMGTSYLDPDMRSDYTGTDYFVMAVELRDALPGAPHGT